MKQKLRAGITILVAGILVADIASARSSAKGNVSSAKPAIGQDAKSGRNEIEWIKVLPAERLIDQDVVSSDGRSLGRIASVMVDVASGDVVYVIVSADRDQLAIPFRALELRGWRDGQLIRVDETYRRVLRNSPRTAGGQVEDIGDRKRIARTNRAFGVPSPYGYVMPPNPDRETLPNRYLLVRPRSLGAFEAGEDAKSADTARAEHIRDRKVLRADGQPVGDIDYVMLDIEAGRIAYLLLSSGEFLGLGGEWIPVPPEALEWSPDKETPFLRKGVKRSALKPLPRSELPSFVRRSQLEALYERFEVTPYESQSRLE